eukprot:CAMPEP_0178443012 /NCGR_PEP_ID=MMETSP0689_2-20121128/38569_1 /TAXON_ID=160604 /ORGANISM="Amphidinium massartii, Strain CS-259" /LENGTH=422 /DNA_ID=CAMNT_0020066793 /DNA_START=62 /DNA_END=1326 /DNA_ORIENTATION=+
MSHVFGCKQTPDTPPSTSDEESSGNSSDGEAKKKKGNRAMGKSKYPKAIKYYTKAIKLEPKNPSYVLNRAIANAALELWKDAEADAAKAVELGNPPSAKSHFQLARARLKRGQCEQAMAAVKIGLQSYPDEPALIKLQKEIEKASADLQAKRRREAEAEAAQSQAAQGPRSSRALLDRARSLCNAGQAQEALPLLAEARAAAAGASASRPGEESQREEIAVLSLLGKAHMQLRQWPQAVEAFQELVKLEDEVFSMAKAEEKEALSNAFNNLGIACKNAGQLQEAVKALNSAYQRATNGDDKVATPQAAQILQNIGQCLRAMKKPDEAARTFARSLEIGQRLYSEDHASHALSYIGIARCYRDAGRLKEAIESYTKAMEIFMAKDAEKCAEEIPEAPSKERVLALQQQCRTELAQLMALLEHA